MVTDYQKVWSLGTTRSVILISISELYHLLLLPGVVTPPYLLYSSLSLNCIICCYSLESWHHQICSTHLYLYTVSSAATAWSRDTTRSVLLISISILYHLLLKYGVTDNQKVWSLGTTRSVILISISVLYHLLLLPGVVTLPDLFCSSLSLNCIICCCCLESWHHQICSVHLYLWTVSSAATAWTNDTTRSVLPISISELYHLLLLPGVVTPPDLFCSSLSLNCIICCYCLD